MNEESLFAAALERPTPAARRAFLDEACAGDDRLRQRIERLLAADQDTRNILHHPEEAAAGVLDTARPAAPLGADRAFAGRFTLRQKLGEGGMGEVWAADQHEPVRRRVALKVIRPGFASARLLTRFEQERQALALMNHPNVARVLDAGVEGGRPYFVMEFIEGAALTRHCDEARLTVRERLELFVAVCAAVQHAHQKGVIHRDLKPSNILVESHDGRPVPRVIDFGLAKSTGPPLTDRDATTEVGTLMGTLEYVSPEQADLNNVDVDTRCDIYSLGVVLYELLTGGVPFPREQLQAVAFTQMLRIIREVEAPAPSARLAGSETLPDVSAARRAEPKKLTAMVRGELDWIVMKCLEKDRDRRYQSANEVAADLGRYLADEPVLAGPPSAGYRLRKYARKHRKALATAAAFAALLVAATAGSIGLASWALRERGRAEVQKRSAEASFKKALEAVDQMLTRVGDVHLEHVPQMELVRRDLLQDALRFYQEFLRERGDSPAVRSEAANAYKRVGHIQALLGRHDEGEEAYRQAAALLEKLLDESPGDPPLLNTLAGIHSDLGMIYHATRRAPQAEAAFRRGVEVLEQGGPREAMPATNRLILAGIENNRVVLYRSLDRLDDAETAFRECRTITENLLAGDQGHVKALALLAACHLNVGIVYAARANTREAEAAHQKARDLYQRLLRDDPYNVDHRQRLAKALNNLGDLYTQTRRHDKAAAPYRQSLDLHKALLADHPRFLSFRVDLAASYGNMASHVRRTGSAEDALKLTDQSILTLESVLKEDSRNAAARRFLFGSLMGRGYTFVRLERQEDAVKDWRRMLEISEGQSHPSMRVYRPFALVFLGEHARATAEIETLVTEGQTQGRNPLLFAIVHSRCSAVVASDARVPLPVREKVADRYGGRAVELLRMAQAAGLFRDPAQVAQVRDSKELKTIGSRPDFTRLLGELEGR